MADTTIAERRVPEEIQNGLIPVGGIIPFYDFNGAISKPSSFEFCDGSVIADAASPINGQTLPDVSGRYLVGFGSDGGGDIDTAAWGTAPVGNTNHVVDLQHSHTVNSHSHTVNSHSHGAGSLRFETLHVTDPGLADAIEAFNSGGSAVTIALDAVNAYQSGANATAANITGGDATFYTRNGTGSSDSSSPGTSSSAPGTNNQLSTAQSIQPSSIRVRHIMRIK